MVSAHRPAGASFGAFWAAVSACLNFLAAFALSLLGSVYLGDPLPVSIMAACQMLLGMVLFAVFAIFNLTSLFAENYSSGCNYLPTRFAKTHF